MADKSDKRKSVSKVVWKGDAESFPYFNSQIRSYAISKGAVYNAVLNGKNMTYDTRGITLDILERIEAEKKTGKETVDKKVKTQVQ